MIGQQNSAKTVASADSTFSLAQLNIESHWKDEYAQLDQAIISASKNLPASLNDLLIHNQIEQQLPHSNASISREQLFESRILKQQSSRVLGFKTKLYAFKLVIAEFKRASFFSLPNLLACMSHVAALADATNKDNVIIRVDDFSQQQLQQLADVCHIINRKDLAASLRAALVYGQLMQLALLPQHNEVLCRALVIAILTKSLAVEVIAPVSLYFNGVGNKIHQQALKELNHNPDKFFAMFSCGVTWANSKLQHLSRDLNAIANEAFDLKSLDISFSWQKIFELLISHPIFSFSQFAAELPLCERSVLRLLVALTKVGLVQRYAKNIDPNLSIWQVPAVLNCLKEFDRQCLIPELIHDTRGFDFKTHAESDLRHGGIYQSAHFSHSENITDIVARNYLKSNDGLVKAG